MHCTAQPQQSVRFVVKLTHSERQEPDVAWRASAGGPGNNGADAARKMPGWEALGGLQAVVAQLKQMVLLPLLYPDLFSHVGVVPRRHASTP